MKKVLSAFVTCILGLSIIFIILIPVILMLTADGDTFNFFGGMGCFSFYLARISYSNSFYKIKNNNEIQQLTAKRLLYDLSPKVWISIFRYFICFSFGILGAIVFVPELSGAENDIWNSVKLFAILFLFGLCANIIIFANLYKLSEKKYTLKSYRCSKNNSEYDYDYEERTYYVKFDGIKKESRRQHIYNHAEKGEYYYVIMNRKQKIVEIYDVKKWIPSLKEQSLSSSFMSVVGKICVETLLYSSIMFLLPVIVKLILPVVEQFF